MMPAHASTPPAHQRRGAQPGDLLPLGDWVRHHSLRSWPVLLFLVLICVPSIALVALGPNPSPARFDAVAWIFAVPVLVVALIYRGRRNLQPRDYLFVGAVSGLVFGASEVVRYFTVNGVAEFYLTVKASIPAIARKALVGALTIRVQPSAAVLIPSSSANRCTIMSRPLS